jgi:uncharacterized protein GlcG (DUF336 family)
MTITLAQAQKILEGAFAKAAELKLKPLGAAVVDAGGHVIAVQRQDGASTLRPEVAIAKAAGALALGVSSRTIAGMAAERPAFITNVGALSARGLVPSPGGVIIVDDKGAFIGAVGASGDTGDNDEVAVLAGIAAAGLKAQ